MKKNEQTLQNRQALIELAINDQKEAAKYFELAALSINQCNNTAQIIDVLSRVLFLSPRTIENDLYKEVPQTLQPD